MTLEGAFVGLIVALCGAAGLLVWAIAKFLAKQLETFNGMVTDLKDEVKVLREQDQEKELEIRDLLKQLAEIPRLELKVEKQNSEIVILRKDFETMKTAREQRELELQAERQEKEKIQGQFRDLQDLFVKERGEWQLERDNLRTTNSELNRKVIDLTEKVKLLEPRMDTVEAKLGTNEMEAVKDETNGEAA